MLQATRGLTRGPAAPDVCITLLNGTDATTRHTWEAKAWGCHCRSPMSQCCHQKPSLPYPILVYLDFSMFLK